MERPATKVAAPRHERGDLPAFEDLLAQGSFHARLAKARARREKSLARMSEKGEEDFILTPGRKPWEKSGGDAKPRRGGDDSKGAPSVDPAILAMSQSLKQVAPAAKVTSIGKAEQADTRESPKPAPPVAEAPEPSPAPRPKSPLRVAKAVPPAPFAPEDWEELELPIAPQNTIATLAPPQMPYLADEEETEPAPAPRRRDYRIAAGFAAGVLIGIIGAFWLGRGDVAPAGSGGVVQAAAEAPAAEPATAVPDQPVLVSANAPARAAAAPDYAPVPFVPTPVAPGPHIVPPAAFDTIASAMVPDARPPASSPVGADARTAPASVVPDIAALSDPGPTIAVPATVHPLRRMAQPAAPEPSDSLPAAAPALPRTAPANLASFARSEPLGAWPDTLNAPGRSASPTALAWSLGEPVPTPVLASVRPRRPDLGAMPEGLASLGSQDAPAASPVAILPWEEPDRFYALPSPEAGETDLPVAVPPPAPKPSSVAPAVQDATVTVHAPTSVPEAKLVAVMAKLVGGGHTLDPARRVSFSISQSNVRYFHPADADLARSLADKIGAVARDFTNYTPAPPAGTIEVWLSGSGPKVAATSGGKNVVRPPKQVQKLLQLRNRILRRLRNGEHL